ncbi:hypothetical protein XBP1_2420011 [Xenorhabdus bovienii str. puntauvense]|uniref:Uncharacterized protein n=3 Tax=Xenorhabdus bovienii TaxID=40576 RepID=A0A0B6X3J7_XENBV|nr:hypothetical protein XBFFR1_1200012 [Xenorhabdus bovienii str. feltiae France]CDG93215.1 hypothetical protein XBFFL1_2430012 [Xenorhabdus bovienii str. feltiae Florida]CDG96969.1 hypothetical protein XBP1_2420011 [Xenorhabdus bovienii str. puntauvense]CDH01210.1 hypothetical protein XBFM1_2040038 [Xenorhabdus bovienii str. feltiae Moldova]CDM87721.1 protein of unknown function [Xenorhabdus bovienii]
MWANMAKGQYAIPGSSVTKHKKSKPSELTGKAYIQIISLKNIPKTIGITFEIIL